MKRCHYYPKIGGRDKGLNRNIKNDVVLVAMVTNVAIIKLDYHAKQWCHQSNVNLIFYYSLISGLLPHFVKWFQCKNFSKMKQLHCILLI